MLQWSKFFIQETIPNYNAYRLLIALSALTVHIHVLWMLVLFRLTIYCLSYPVAVLACLLTSVYHKKFEAQRLNTWKNPAFGQIHDCSQYLHIFKVVSFVSFNILINACSCELSATSVLFCCRPTVCLN